MAYHQQLILWPLTMAPICMTVKEHTFREYDKIIYDLSLSTGAIKSNEESKPDDLPPQSFEHYHECLHWSNVLGAKHVINRCGCLFRKLLGFKAPLCEVLSGQDRSPGSLHQEKQTLRFESLLMFPSRPHQPTGAIPTGSVCPHPRAGWYRACKTWRCWCAVPSCPGRAMLGRSAEWSDDVQPSSQGNEANWRMRISPWCGAQDITG